MSYPPPVIERVEDLRMGSDATPAISNHVLDIILGRSSTKKFADTPVTREQLDVLLSAAVRAPDHGLLAPWRFTVVEGGSRAVLGNAMAAGLREKSPDADSETLEREAAKAWRSPTLLVVSAVARSHPKVPEIEQWVAVGAAIQNLWIAAESLGLGAAWKTGSHAYSPVVKRALGLDDSENIIGFIHLGTPLGKGPVRPADFASRTRWL
jgi:nitroreductase